MNFFFSTVGRKIQVAFTGFVLSFFLLFHLANNLVLYSGPTNFNEMVGMLESIKPLIRIMEFCLLSIIFIHIFHAISLTIINKKLRSNQYQYNLSHETSSLNSRTMALSGSAILFFIIIHLGYISRTFQTHAFHSNEETYYDVVLRSEFGYLNNLPTAILYIIAIVLIGVHLKHGFQSALKTFGIIPTGSKKALYNLSMVFWAIIPLGFIAIILSIQIGIIR